MFMKKIRYLFSIILISACNYKDNESNDPYDKGLFVPENFKQLTLDSLKPPKVIIAGTPQLVDVPIKKGNSYFYKFKDGENKNILAIEDIRLAFIIISESLKSEDFF